MEEHAAKKIVGVAAMAAMCISVAVAVAGCHPSLRRSVPVEAKDNHARVKIVEITPEPLAVLVEVENISNGPIEVLPRHFRLQADDLTFRHKDQPFQLGSPIGLLGFPALGSGTAAVALEASFVQGALIGLGALGAAGLVALIVRALNSPSSKLEPGETSRLHVSFPEVQVGETGFYRFVDDERVAVGKLTLELPGESSEGEALRLSLSRDEPHRGYNEVHTTPWLVGLRLGVGDTVAVQEGDKQAAGGLELFTGYGGNRLAVLGYATVGPGLPLGVDLRFRWLESYWSDGAVSLASFAGAAVHHLKIDGVEDRKRAFAARIGIEVGVSWPRTLLGWRYVPAWLGFFVHAQPLFGEDIRSLQVQGGISVFR